MKKSIITIGLILIIFSSYMFGRMILFKEEKTPEIISHLKDNGTINGKREFVYSLTNKGDEVEKLKFLSWLEYSITLDNEGEHKGIPEGIDIIEHVDLNKENKEGRTVILKPNETIEYRVRIGPLPEGEYRINMSSALEFEYYKTMTFIVGD